MNLSYYVYLLISEVFRFCFCKVGCNAFNAAELVIPSAVV